MEDPRLPSAFPGIYAADGTHRENPIKHFAVQTAD